MIQLHLGSYDEVLSGVKADLIFTSPPYNIGSKSDRKDGYRKRGKYDPKSYGAIRDYPDDLPEEEYQMGQVAFLDWAASHLAPNGTIVYNHKPRRNGRMIHPLEWINRVSDIVLMEEVIWDRGSTHNHSNKMLWAQTERLYVLRRKGDEYRFINSSNLQFRSDVWKIPRARPNGHNAPFHIDLAMAVVEAWSSPGDLVIDPYAGSGTVALACRKLGRRFKGAEILPRYYEMSRQILEGYQC